MSIGLIVSRGYGNGTYSGTIKDVVLRGYSIGAESAPVFSGPIPDIVVNQDTGSQVYDFTSYFTYATSYSIAPAIPAGWTFTNGVFTVLTDVSGSFGPYIVTGTNGAGSADSNSFSVTVNQVSDKGTGGGRYGRVNRPITWTPSKEVEKDSKFTLADQEELKDLLRESIKKEDAKRQAKRIAKAVADNANAVADIRQASADVEREVQALMVSHKITQEVARKRVKQLREEEDIIISILLSEMV